MGRYYEDFTVGDTYKHWPGRTITAADNTWFTLLTMNQHPIHFDEEYAARTEFGKPLVNSAFTLAVVVGMSVADVSQNAVANLGWTDICCRRRCSTATRCMRSRRCSTSANRSRDLRRASSPYRPADGSRTAPPS